MNFGKSLLWKNGTFPLSPNFVTKVERPHSLTQAIDIIDFSSILKHAKVVAERHIFFVPSDKTCFEDPLPPYRMILNLDPVISSFAVFC